jgi:hypothetical protein
LSIGELEKVILQHSQNPRELAESPLDSVFSSVNVIPQEGLDCREELLGTEGSGSGGFLEYIMIYAAHVLFGKTINLKDLKIITVKNRDFKEYILEVRVIRCIQPSFMSHAYRTIREMRC